MTQVSIVKEKLPLTDSKVDAMLEKGISLLGGIHKIVKDGDVVVIKPNLVAPIPPPGTTDPKVIASMVRLCKQAGAKDVFVGENCAPHGKVAPYLYGSWTTRTVFEKLGIKKVVEMVGGEILPFDEVEHALVKVEDARILRKAKVPKIILDCDVLIDVPVMKTHFYTLVTLGAKNMHGILPDELKVLAHREDLDQFLVDIIKIRKPDLTVIDGLRALQGYDHHVTMEDLVETNLLVCGKEDVATDAVGAAVMGFDPCQEITHIRLAYMEKVGVADLEKIEVKGHSIQEVKRRFKRPDQRLFGIYPNIEIYSGGACNYCLVRTKVALERLKQDRRMGEEKFSVILGHRPILPSPEQMRGKVIAIGDCAVFAVPDWIKLELGERFTSVSGCPPMWTLDMATRKLFPEK
jgi:uncharacterized protein (DUF362 family)